MHDHAKMVWGCAVVILVAIILGTAGVDVGAAVFAIPCVLMMGMMVWMMARGMGHASHRRREHNG